MHESILQFEGEFNYVRNNKLLPGRITLLFIHGLGDSGLAFQEVFEDKRLGVNIIVPDMTGYGRSSESANGDYGFDSYIDRIWNIIERMGGNDLIAIGHSMGGDIATLLCASDQKNIIKKFVNIEGNLTQFDLFISSSAVSAERDGNFEDWFNEEFIKSKVLGDWAQRYDSCKRYYESLCNCRPDAFLANARELYERNTALPGKYKSEIGQIYCSLSIPKMFCYGTESISSGTVNFVKENNLEHKALEGAFHWAMIDKAVEFYPFLYNYIS